ncbi:Rrf2 family transcriptional regulator [Sporolactobacillus vineae]|uniref:Rrf2 family transcriptional regulator n=1 Tax=Sporolactobacillus vineae TaxID=444463 RepID=UPI00028A1379|nr:Rrf2 family transcriptional regulator [Sporolactobacillus vineae]
MINSRVAVAIHILALIASRPHDDLPSDYIASSVNTNPVVIRRILGMLRKAGLIRTSVGKAGAALAKEPFQISLLEVYQAVEKDSELFAVHENPNPHCPVGKRINAVLNEAFHSAQSALENKLAAQNIQGIMDHLFNEG